MDINEILIKSMEMGNISESVIEEAKDTDKIYFRANKTNSRCFYADNISQFTHAFKECYDTLIGTYYNIEDNKRAVLVRKNILNLIPQEIIVYKKDNEKTVVKIDLDLLDDKKYCDNICKKLLDTFDKN